MSSTQEQYYRVEIKRYPALAAEAELSLFIDYRKNKTAAKRETIVRQYLYWATELACRYCGPRMSKAEAISAANLGLMQAIDRFNPDSGRRFVTYSYFAIRREILHALRDSYVVNPESGICASRYLLKKSARGPEDIEQHERACRNVFNSVGAPSPIGPAGADSGGSEFFGDQFLEDDGRAGLERASLLDLLGKALPSLSTELQSVVKFKYFNGAEPLSFSEIGIRLGCSEKQVRRLHAQALKELRKNLRHIKKEL